MPTPPKVFFMPHSRPSEDTMGRVIRRFLGAILNLSVYPQLSYSSPVIIPVVVLE